MSSKVFSTIAIVVLAVLIAYFIYDIYNNRRTIENFNNDRNKMLQEFRKTLNQKSDEQKNRDEEEKEKSDSEAHPTFEERHAQYSEEEEHHKHKHHSEHEEEEHHHKHKHHSEHEEEEHHHKHKHHSEHEEEEHHHKHKHHSEHEEEEHHHKHSAEEEEMTHKVIKNIESEKKNKILTHGEHEIKRPDTQTFRFNNPPSAPLNINVSYNSKHSINDSNFAKDDIYSNSGSMGTRSQPRQQQHHQQQYQQQQYQQQNSVPSDYGKLTWNTLSDYYIPGVTNVNKNYNTGSDKQSDACPILDNRPWADYKSGDDKHSK